MSSDVSAVTGGGVVLGVKTSYRVKCFFNIIAENPGKTRLLQLLDFDCVQQNKNNICSHQTHFMGSKYPKKCINFPQPHCGRLADS